MPRGSDQPGDVFKEYLDRIADVLGVVQERLPDLVDEERRPLADAIGEMIDAQKERELKSVRASLGVTDPNILRLLDQDVQVAKGLLILEEALRRMHRER